MKTNKVLVLSVILVLMLSAAGLTYNNVIARPSGLGTAPGLGAAGDYSLLAGLSASSANTTTLGGSLGISPGLTVTGPFIVGGTTDLGPATNAANAQNDALGAFNNLAGQGSDGAWGGNANPVPGVWTDSSSPVFSGTLTLTGDYADVWVFQITSDLTFTGSVVMAGNAQACNVYWQVSRDATIASGSSFIGTLIASRDVTVVSGANVSGRIFSLNSSVTTDNNSISMPPCASAPAPTAIPTAAPAAPTAPAAPAILPDNPQPEGISPTIAADNSSAAGVPSTGGAPLRDENSIWILGGISGLSAVALFFGIRKIRQIFGSK